MTGLEKILKEIESEAAHEAESTLSAAKSEAEDILSAARQEGEKAAALIAAENEKAVAEAERSNTSALDLQRRQRILETKQGLLAETLEKALQTLQTLPEKDYFDFLVKLAAKNAAPGEGELLLDEKDLARLPAGFEKQLLAALPAGSKLAVSKQTRSLNGGFVLKYGLIEQNCSFGDILTAQSDDLTDMIRDVLFA